MTNLEIAESLSCIFEILNCPRKSNKRSLTYLVKDIDLLMDKLEIASKELGLDMYGEDSDKDELELIK